MKKCQIETAAGKIWKRLETNLTDTNIDTLKKDYNFEPFELFAALGWLAKEGKIVFINNDTSTYIFPVEFSR